MQRRHVVRDRESVAASPPASRPVRRALSGADSSRTSLSPLARSLTAVTSALEALTGVAVADQARGDSLALRGGLSLGFLPCSAPLRVCLTRPPSQLLTAAGTRLEGSKTLGFYGLPAAEAHVFLYQRCAHPPAPPVPLTPPPAAPYCAPAPRRRRRPSRRSCRRWLLRARRSLHRTCSLGAPPPRPLRSSFTPAASQPTPGRRARCSAAARRFSLSARRRRASSPSPPTRLRLLVTRWEPTQTVPCAATRRGPRSSPRCAPAPPRAWHPSTRTGSDAHALRCMPLSHSARAPPRSRA